MNKYILISKEIKDSINLLNEQIEQTELYNIIILENINDKIHELLNKRTDNPIYAILFLNHIEFNKIYSFLNNLNYTNFFHKVIVICSDEELGAIDQDKLHGVSDFRTSKILFKEFKLIVQIMFSQIDELYKSNLKKDKTIIQLLDTKQDQEDLIDIGKALSTEKSPNKLLNLILFLSKKITGADAGSIYLIEKIGNGKNQLRFKYSHTFGRILPFEEHTLTIDKNSIAGYVAVTGEVLNISDVYKLSPNDRVSFNSSFDKTHNYRTKSMLVVPMKNHLDQIIGVIQLINSKEQIKGDKRVTGNEAFEIFLENEKDFDTKVVPFDSKYENLMEAVAGQAAIAIENNRMIKQIQTQFEEFVKASVTAIESRDIATSGHSFRVAEICKEIARAINNERAGVFKKIFFSDTEIKELEFAALLHDFGKVYIDLAIFQKAKKLYPKEFENLLLKLQYLYRFIELNYTFHESLTSKTKNIYENRISDIEELKDDKKEKLNRIKNIIEMIKILNEPTITEGDPDDKLIKIIDELEKIECFDIEGRKIELLTDTDRMNLKIKRGSLNPLERKEIESHVVYTYNFVNNIPWPPEFKNIPEIVLKHHEKLDGSGYPNCIEGRKNINIQARMMTIADIYDSLIASDRPYKKSITQDKALSILDEEAKSNKIDKDLLNIFMKYNIYEKIDKNDFKLKK